jgi:hypothetical protein
MGPLSTAQLTNVAPPLRTVSSVGLSIAEECEGKFPFTNGSHLGLGQREKY